jgi:hypothetical protein
VSAEVPACASLAECRAHDGERVEVVGTYTVWDPMPDRPDDLDPPRQVIIAVEPDGGGPYLGAWGRPGHHRELAEIASLGGRKVRVVGTFHADMPPHPTDPPEAASLGGPCIHPVESIRPA